MIKIDLITGFLGSGKTTFIKKYGAYLMRQGLKVGILENDYGAVNVDMMLMQDLQEEGCGLEMVAGGCDADCHRRRFKTKLIAMGMSGYDRVIVEPSGIFDVDEFFDALHEDPLDRWYEIGSVIAIVDAGLEEQMSEQSDYLLASQVANAGRIVLSHVQETTLEDIRRTIGHINRALDMVKCGRRFEPENMAGMMEPARLNGAESTGDMAESKNYMIVAQDWNTLTDETLQGIMNSGYVSEDYVKILEEDSSYSSLYFMNIRIPQEELTAKVQALMQDSGFGQIFRIKGFMQLADDSWIELNATHKQITVRPIPKGQEIIIVIGEGLVEAEIRKYWEE